MRVLILIVAEYNAAWRDRRAANAVLVVPLAQHLDRFVELGLGQDLIAPIVKRVPGSTANRLPLRGAVRRLLSLVMPSRLELHHTNVHRFGTSAVCQRTAMHRHRRVGDRDCG
jgi:hypothetical protein